MFVLEIGFKDNESQPEILMVRRPQALIGAAETAHISIDDMSTMNFQILISQLVGRQFSCKIVPLSENSTDVPQLETELFDSVAFLDLGTLRITVVSLESDLLIKAGEPPDKAGARILKRACSVKTPVFPAVVSLGEYPFAVSLQEDQPIYVGRSNKCLVRFDESDISSKHLRIGSENGQFWVEDLGSTNGTFVNGRQISGHINVAPETQIQIGSKIMLCGITTQQSLNEVLQLDEPIVMQETTKRYPILYSLSEVARPARLVLEYGQNITIGRDPSCDLWLGAPHVSRRHCIVSYEDDGKIKVIDTSTNGTVHDAGILAHGEVLEITETPKVFNFGGNLTVAICFNEEQEEVFEATKGAVDSFYSQPSGERKRVTTGRALVDMLNPSPSQIGMSSADRVFEKVSPIDFSATELNDINDFKKYFMSFPLVKKILWIVILLLANTLLIVFLNMFWNIVKGQMS